MFPGMEAVVCPNLAVPAQVMRHVVHVESGANPFAIGVVGGRLVRQPKTLEEARATAQMLESKGYNYSLGAAQINRVNFRKYGLDSYEKAFDPCANLNAGASILAGCYASAGGDWGKAFSCYYSGNFTTGFRHGYVQKIYDSINHAKVVAQLAPPTVAAIPLRTTAATPVTALAPAVAQRAEAEQPQPVTAASRIAMRVVPFGTTAATPAIPAVSMQAQQMQAPVRAPDPPPANVVRPEVFVPQIRYPGAGNVPNAPAPAPAPTQAAPIDRPAGDGAFVF